MIQSIVSSLQKFTDSSTINKKNNWQQFTAYDVPDIALIY